MMDELEKYFRLPAASALPLYRQIQDNLIELIEGQVLNAGDPLPAERHLSALYAVNRMTVRQAIDGLVRRGLIERRRGSGTFIAAPPVQQFTPTVIGFSQRMWEAGLIPSSRLLHREIIIPEPLVARRLQLEPDQPAIMLKRLRLVNHEPLMLETSYLPYALFPKLLTADLERESLYRLLEQEYGVTVAEAEHTMEPALPNAFEAGHLGVLISDPAMLVRVVAYSAPRTPIEMSKAVVRGDRCRYFFRVHTRVPIMD